MRYAIGFPGQLARVFLDDDLAGAARQVRPGEVTVPFEGAARPIISGDGSHMLPPPPLPVERVREACKADARACRDAVLRGGCATPLGRVQTDEASQTNIIGAMILAQDAKAVSAPFALYWRMEDNSLVSHDADQMIAMARAVGQFKTACFAASFVIADAIDASDDPAAVDIRAGYPASTEE